MQRHELAQLAFDCALHGLPEPDVPWRNELPKKSFSDGFLSSGRSANIETLSVAAWILFLAHGHAPKKELDAALRTAADLLLANQRAFMLNEFGSTTYSGWTITGWAGLVEGLKILGQEKLVAGFRALLTQWFALARAGLAQCPADGLNIRVHYTGKGGTDEVLDESRHAGKWVVVLCGERSWGHGHGLGYAHHGIARIAFGIERPKPKSQLPDPGRLDGWQERALVKLTPSLTVCAAPAMAKFAEGDWAGLVELLKYPAANSCELRLYRDGSRVFVEGGDEPEPVDEDDNSNTPRLALMAVYRTPPKILSLPPWPAPNSGDTRIRQKNIVSDIDRDVHGGGWVLFHSDVGTERAGDRWLSKAPDPKSELVARITCFGGEGWVLNGPRPETPAAPTPTTPPPPAKPKPVAGSRRGWLCARMRRLLGLK